jgi:hypothetical protein
MRLTDLDARFLHDAKPDGSSQMSDEYAGACGVMFQCPKCAQGKTRGQEVVDGRTRHFVINAHYVICWFRGKVSDDLNPKPGRWTPSGTCMDDLTFVPGDPPQAVSVLMTGPGCGWHGFVRNGEATLS